MDEADLKKHLEKFHTGKRSGDYLLDVDCPNSSTGLWLKDRLQAWRICETAFKSGAATMIRLSFYPNKNTEEILFDSKNKGLVEKMEQSLKRQAEKRSLREK